MTNASPFSGRYSHKMIKIKSLNKVWGLSTSVVSPKKKKKRSESEKEKNLRNMECASSLCVHNTVEEKQRFLFFFLKTCIVFLFAVAFFTKAHRHQKHCDVFSAEMIIRNFVRSLCVSLFYTTHRREKKKIRKHTLWAIFRS